MDFYRCLRNTPKGITSPAPGMPGLFLAFLLLIQSQQLAFIKSRFLLTPVPQPVTWRRENSWLFQKLGQGRMVLDK